jgi:hypothetical protein
MQLGQGQCAVRADKQASCLSLGKIRTRTKPDKHMAKSTAELGSVAICVLNSSTVSWVAAEYAPHLATSQSLPGMPAPPRRQMHS